MLQRCVAIKIVFANRPVKHHLKSFSRIESALTRYNVVYLTYFRADMRSLHMHMDMQLVR